MSRSLIIFTIICALGIGAVLVYTKNNIRPADEKVNLELSQLPPKTDVVPEVKLNQEVSQPGITNMQTQKIMEVKELKIEEITEGTGSQVKDGDTVEVNYLGTLLSGEKFDSSYDRGQTFSFTVGGGQVIEGWDKGLVGMKTGGKRKLYIPSDMGYGSQGQGPIPPNSPLYFEVELVSIKP